MLLGGHVGDMEIEFGEKATKLPAKDAPEAVVRVVGSSPASATPARRSQRGSTARAARRGRQRRSRTSTSSRPPTSARLLHRLRRDRALRGRGRRQRVRDVTGTSRRSRRDGRHTSQPFRPRGARRGVGGAGDEARVGGGALGVGDVQGPGLVLAASFQDCVLIDVAMQVAPEIEVVFLDTQYHFAETLWYVDRARALRPQPHGRGTADRARRPLAVRHRRLLRDAQGRAARPCAPGQGAWLPGSARRGVDPCQRTDRRPTTSGAAS